MTSVEIQNFLDENVSYLTEENIHEISNLPGQGGEVNNVIRLINRDCFGILGFENYYEIFYISNSPNLKGLLIKISTDNISHNVITLSFAMELKKMFPYNKLDMFDVANVFQQHKRTYFSKIGDNFVFDSVELHETFGDGTSIFLHNPIDITHFDKLSFYKDIFKDVDISKIRSDNSRNNKVYILFNKRNNLFKIGRSINANYREKTLQGEDPHIELIACWIAPKIVEKELHSRFKDNCIRGEWFSLDINHLEEIDVIMIKYR